MKMKSFYILLAVGLTLFAVTGCGEKKLDNLNVASGVVTLDGQPIEGASITLVPEGGGRGAGAVSDAKGVFTFQTLQANDGVQDGTYTVTVSKFRTENPYTDEEARMLSESGKRHKDVFGNDRPEPKVINDLPEKYNNPKTSGLSITIKGATKDLKIELTSN